MPNIISITSLKALSALYARFAIATQPAALPSAYSIHQLISIIGGSGPEAIHPYAQF
jgi:hypothetical protein